MKVLNNFVKGLALFGVVLASLFGIFVLWLAVTCCLGGATVTIIGIINKGIPTFIAVNMWKVEVLSALFFTGISTIITFLLPDKK